MASHYQNHLCSWDEFKALVDEREPKMLKAFTCMEVTTAGDLEQKSIKGAYLSISCVLSLQR